VGRKLGTVRGVASPVASITGFVQEICQNVSLYLAALHNTPLKTGVVKKGRLSLRVRQKRSRVILGHLTGGPANPSADYALTASTHAVSFPFLLYR
jgi:hypothetical protein